MIQIFDLKPLLERTISRVHLPKMKFLIIFCSLLLSSACQTVESSPNETTLTETTSQEAEVVSEAADSEESIEPVTLRLSVALTPQELATFEAALTAVDDAHDAWDVELELIPQQSVAEKINTQLAAGELPDVFRAQGLTVQQWIRQGAFLQLDSLLAESELTSDQFFPGPLAQFVWNDSIWGLPDTAAPEVVFYNKDMFDEAGLDYPTDDWTFEDMREAAILLTLDANGRNPTDPDFDPETIQQWGWNGGLTYFWQRHMVRGFGGDFCANEDCTEMRFTDPETVTAVDWWASLTNSEHAALYDPYGGSQTGVPGDPFISGKAAMGFNGFFAVGQLNDAGNINYGIVQPFKGYDDKRYTPLSTNGYVISANTEHPEAAWELVQALLANEFLAETWGKPGHSVPARIAAADSVINPEFGLENQEAIVAAMSYGEVFKPYTASAFAAYGQTADLFVQIMKGELSAADGLAQIEIAANEALAADRSE